MENLEEMDKFLETCTVPRLNQEELENLNRVTPSNETESVSKKFQKTKGQGQDGFTREFYQTCKEELIPILFKLQLTLEQCSFNCMGPLI